MTPPAAGPAQGAVVGADGLARPAWAAADGLLRDYYDTEARPAHADDATARW